MNVDSLRKYLTRPGNIGLSRKVQLELLDEIERLNAVVEHAQAVLEDFAKFGCSHNISPTASKSMDEYVRKRAKEALDFIIKEGRNNDRHESVARFP